MKVPQRLHYNFPIKENDIVYTYLKKYVNYSIIEYLGMVILALQKTDLEKQDFIR